MQTRRRRLAGRPDGRRADSGAWCSVGGCAGSVWNSRLVVMVPRWPLLFFFAPSSRHGLFTGWTAQGGPVRTGGIRRQRPRHRRQQGLVGDTTYNYVHGTDAACLIGRIAKRWWVVRSRGRFRPPGALLTRPAHCASICRFSPWLAVTPSLPAHARARLIQGSSIGQSDKGMTGSGPKLCRPPREVGCMAGWMDGSSRSRRGHLGLARDARVGIVSSRRVASRHDGRG